MKRVILMMLLTSSITFVYAQDLDSVTLSRMRLNFTVPDMPAFKTLGTEPSDLLRPSNVKELAVSLSTFSSDGKFIVPEAVAIEVAPALLLHNNKGPTALQAYAKRAVLNSFRISLGSSTDTTLSPSGRNLALGMRISLINKGDLSTDVAMLRLISAKLKVFRLTEREYRKQFGSKHLKFVKELAGDADPTHVTFDAVVDGDLVLSEKIRKDSVWADRYQVFKDSLRNGAEDFDSWIEAMKSDYKRKSWNASKLDLALTVLSSSPDSLVKNIRFNKTSLWITAAFRTGDHSQLMVGLTGSVYKDLMDVNDETMDDAYAEFSVPARYLMGTNRIKGFAEVQYSYSSQHHESKALFNAGAEINIIDGFWLNLYGGVDYSSVLKAGTFVTNFNMKFTLPENFSLF